MAAALVLFGVAAPQAFGQTGVTVAVDVDVSGNNARTVGAIDTCARIDRTGANTLEIDVVLPSPGIPGDLGIKAWQFDLAYDSRIVRVIGHDAEFLLAAAPGSSLFTQVSDAVPDSSGAYTSAGADFGTAFQIEPEGVQEVGPGVIARITLEGVGRGKSNLTLEEVILVDVNNQPIPIGRIQGAAVAVDEPCSAPPAPTVLPEGQPPFTGGDDPLQPDDPDADDPAASQTPGAQPGDPDQPDTDATPGPRTPTADDITSTPTASEEDEDAGPDNDGGGLSALAWAGIGVGAAAAVAAASGGGWLALRRLRAGGPE